MIKLPIPKKDGARKSSLWKKHGKNKVTFELDVDVSFAIVFQWWDLQFCCWGENGSNLSTSSEVYPSFFHPFRTEEYVERDVVQKDYHQALVK